MHAGGVQRSRRPINHCAVPALTPSLSDEGHGKGQGQSEEGDGGWGCTTVTTL